MSSQPNIEDLFDERRIPLGVGLVGFVLYFPLGLVLAVLRLFIGFHTYVVATVLPKMALRTFILRSLCSILGIWVTQETPENRDPKVKMIVANHTSALDHLALELVMPNILPSVWDLPPLLMWILGYKDMGAKQGRETLIRNATRHCQSSSVPLLAFPEGASTNGKTGLLKFSVWPFSLDHPVQPVVVRLRRPAFANVAPSVLGGRWWLDIFWFLFVPYTNFHMIVLPPMVNIDETPEEFTKRVQITMSQSSGVKVTSHTSADKVEYAKRKLFTLAQANRQPDSNLTDPLMQMAQQVREVLPHVPLGNIRDDLAMTKDVDLTITNILEGRVQYTAVVPSVDASPSPSSSQSNLSHQPTSRRSKSSEPSTPSSPSFSKSSQDRHLSLAERKNQLIENARRRYLQKHGNN